MNKLSEKEIVSVFQWHSKVADSFIESQTIQKLSKASDYVDLGNDKWKNHELLQLFAQLKEWKIRRTLFLGKNNNPQIIISIKNIQFPFLTRLSLNHNNITSIEALCSIFLPELKEISLQNNKIRNLKILQKIPSKHLCLVDLVNNPIINYDQICKLEGKQITWLGLDTMASSQCLQTKWLSKLQTKNLRSIDLENRRRIRIKKFENTIKRKYRKLMLS